MLKLRDLVKRKDLGKPIEKVYELLGPELTSVGVAALLPMTPLAVLSQPDNDRVFFLTKIGVTSDGLLVEFKSGDEFYNTRATSLGDFQFHEVSREIAETVRREDERRKLDSRRAITADTDRRLREEADALKREMAAFNHEMKIASGLIPERITTIIGQNAGEITVYLPPGFTDADVQAAAAAQSGMIATNARQRHGEWYVTLTRKSLGGRRRRRVKRSKKSRRSKKSKQSRRSMKSKRSKRSKKSKRSKH